jgi:hypothetical protein
MQVELTYIMNVMKTSSVARKINFVNFSCLTQTLLQQKHFDLILILSNEDKHSKIFENSNYNILEIDKDTRLLQNFLGFSCP